MKSKEEFKSFVKVHPELIKYVKDGSMTWQKFYELYSLYDEDDNAWSEYLKKPDDINVRINNNTDTTASNFGFGEIMGMLKGIKPEVLQQNINSIQKFLGFVQEFVGDGDKIKTPPKRAYTPRPTGKIFED